MDWSAQTVLITGGSGTFGRSMAAHLLARGVKKLRILSRGEERQRQMALEFPDKRVSFLIGDVRDSARMVLALRGVDVVFHAAALKQIPIVSYNPWEAIATNVVGTENVLQAAMANEVKKTILISSDKAPAPANLYGATKMCAEHLTIASNAYAGGMSPRPCFAVVRYGNVAGSTGSVVDVFRKQYAETGRVKLTDDRMTRFWWPVSEAVAWTAKVAEIAEPGCLYVPLIASVKVLDIALHITGGDRSKIDVVGMRSGEKLHETMLGEEEAARADFGDRMYVVRPDAVEHGVRVSYNSRDNGQWLTGEQAVRLA